MGDVMQQAYFITGTDTDVGKTFVTCLLLENIKRSGRNCFGLKPIAAGAIVTKEGLMNDDAQALLRQGSVALEYHDVNPICLQPAIAPHIAASLAGIQLRVSDLVANCRASIKKGLMVDTKAVTLIEGAGGWHVPVGASEFLSDMVIELQLPVILVIGMKLGCLNHAKLTVDAIESSGLRLAGWVANQVSPEKMPFFEENISAIKELIYAPCLGIVPYSPSAAISDVAHQLDIDNLN